MHPAGPRASEQRPECSRCVLCESHVPRGWCGAWGEVGALGSTRASGRTLHAPCLAPCPLTKSSNLLTHTTVVVGADSRCLPFMQRCWAWRSMRSSSRTRFGRPLRRGRRHTLKRCVFCFDVFVWRGFSSPTRRHTCGSLRCAALPAGPVPHSACRVDATSLAPIPPPMRCARRCGG